MLIYYKKQLFSFTHGERRNLICLSNLFHETQH